MHYTQVHRNTPTDGDSLNELESLLGVAIAIIRNGIGSYTTEKAILGMECMPRVVSATSIRTNTRPTPKPPKKRLANDRVILNSPTKSSIAQHTN